MGAADEYDLTKWAYVNYLSSSTGYFKIARDQAAQHPWEFLARYPDWIRSQDSLHIGTHPPGLIVAQCILLATMERNPALAGLLIDHMPPSVKSGFTSLEGIEGRPIRRSERGQSVRDGANHAPRLRRDGRAALSAGPVGVAGDGGLGRGGILAAGIRPPTCSSPSPIRPIPCYRHRPGRWPPGRYAPSRVRIDLRPLVWSSAYRRGS